MAEFRTTTTDPHPGTAIERACGIPHKGTCYSEIPPDPPRECGGDPADIEPTSGEIMRMLRILRDAGVIELESTPRQTSTSKVSDAEKKAGIAEAERKLATMKRRHSQPQPQSLTDLEWSERRAANELVMDFDYVVNHSPPDPYKDGLEALRRRNERQG